MAAIKGKNTTPEIIVRKMLHSMGLRYRLHDARLPGKPDIVLKKYKTVIFVHGCFWHRHKGCKYATMPSTRIEFWNNKFSGNVRRDIEVKKALRKRGWKILTVWECETVPLKRKALEKKLIRFFSLLRQDC